MVFIDPSKGGVHSAKVGAYSSEARLANSSEIFTKNMTKELKNMCMCMVYGCMPSIVGEWVCG